MVYDQRYKGNITDHNRIGLEREPGLCLVKDKQKSTEDKLNPVRKDFCATLSIIDYINQETYDR